MGIEETFGQRVKDRRRELGLTQDELARRVGCAPVTLRKIEYDDLRPSVQIAERLAMALNILLEERAAFVRLARAERAPEPPTPTPAPALEEIGAEDLSGRAIRGYALGERIGSGGMGAVYRAVQPLVEREVAVKIILPQYANHPEFIRRFEAEAQLVARLEHPHIVPLYDYWREPSVAFLVMRLLRGGSLRHLLESGPLPLEMVLRMMEQVGTALGTAHRAGVIHRDLKPANVLLDEEQNAYLADFGIAKNLGNPNLEDQTQVDAIVGSPAYISPEQIRSEFVRPQTDIYALGVVLYELLTGYVPFSGPTPIEVMHQHLSAPLPPLAARRTGLPGALDAVIERATAKDPLERYPDTDSLLADLRRAMGGVETTRRVASTAVPELLPLTAADNPYKGLRAFGEADAHDFFGREALVQQLLVRMGEGGDLSRFLAVVGPSGSGKSSVVGAGLVPALRRGALPSSENWYLVELMPGAHPFEELEAALLRIAVNPPESLLSQLREDKRGLLRAVHRCLPDDPAIELVLVIDQFEEVFTLVPAEDETVRAHLLDSLVTAALDERSRVRIVVTLRADFTDRPLNYVDFGELVRQRSEFVLALTPDELERAIVGPAERVGLQLEPGLAAAIMHDVGDQPGALPLLQYALTELFEKCIVETRHGASPQGRTLTKAAYQSIGGVLGALGRRAEEVFGGLDEAGQEAARQLFLRLVTLGEGVEDTRRRVLRSELESLVDVMLSEAKHPAVETETLRFAQGDNRRRAIDAVIESFGKHRLLAFDRDPITRGPTVEVAHEALLREWPRLREWLNESRGDVRMERQLANAAAEWIIAGRDPSYLLTGVRLAQFEGWAATSTVALSQEERAFLEACVAERQKREAEEQARQQRELEAARRLAETERARAEEQVRYVSRVRLRNRVITGAGAVAVVLAVLAGFFGLQSSQNATQAEANFGVAQANAATAQAASLLADAQRDSALNAKAAAQAERDRAEAERQLATSRELAAAAMSNLAIDPERSILLAMQGVLVTDTLEAENALHQALQISRLQLTLRGHTDLIWRVAFSPDGTRLATGSKDGTAKVWNTTTGQILLNLDMASEVHAVTFSPDGARLATASLVTGGDAVSVWDTNSGQRLLTLPGYYLCTFSPDGRRIATYNADATVKIWDAATGKELLTLTGASGSIYKLAFSPDGTRLAAGLDKTAKVWDATTGQELLTLRGHTDTVLGVAFSPDGMRLATNSFDATVRVWNIAPDVPAGESRALLTLPGPSGGGGGPSVAFSPNGAQLAAQTGAAGMVTVWDAASGRELFTLAGHTGVVFDLAFNASGTRLATASEDGTARIWDVSPGHELLTLSGHSDAVRGVTFSPDGTRLATASSDGTAKVWDATTGHELFNLSDHMAGVSGVVFNRDGTRIATSGRDKIVIVWDAATREKLLTLSGHTDIVRDVTFSPDGTRLATASLDGTAKVWDAVTGKPLLTMFNATPRVWSVAFSPDGLLLATTGSDEGSNFGSVQVWDANSGKLIRMLRGSPAWGVAFSPDGMRLAVGYSDGTAKIWDVSPGASGKQPLLTLSGHAGLVFDVAFSPDGTRLATAGFDNVAKVWDVSPGVSQGRELLTLPGHTDVLSSVAFSPDGTRLATASWDGTVQVYVLRIEDLMTLAKTRVTRSLTTEECQKYLHVEACPEP